MFLCFFCFALWYSDLVLIWCCGQQQAHVKNIGSFYWPIKPSFLFPWAVNSCTAKGGLEKCPKTCGNYFGELLYGYFLARSLGAKVSLLDSGNLAERFPWLNTDGISLGCVGEGKINRYLIYCITIIFII